MCKKYNPFFCCFLLIQNLVSGIICPGWNLRDPSPHRHPPGHFGWFQGVRRPWHVLLYIPSSGWVLCLPRGLLPVGHGRKTSYSRCPVDILRCRNQINWLILSWILLFRSWLLSHGLKWGLEDLFNKAYWIYNSK